MTMPSVPLQKGELVAIIIDPSVNPAQAIAPGWPEVQAAIETARIFRSSGEQARRGGQVLTAADLDALWERAAAVGSLLPVP